MYFVLCVVMFGVLFVSDGVCDVWSVLCCLCVILMYLNLSGMCVECVCM